MIKQNIIKKSVDKWIKELKPIPIKLFKLKDKWILPKVSLKKLEDKIKILSKIYLKPNKNKNKPKKLLKLNNNKFYLLKLNIQQLDKNLKMLIKYLNFKLISLKMIFKNLKQTYKMSILRTLNYQNQTHKWQCN